MIPLKVRLVHEAIERHFVFLRCPLAAKGNDPWLDLTPTTNPLQFTKPPRSGGINAFAWTDPSLPKERSFGPGQYLTS
ncbi:hypothetical protein CLV78_110149 [Aliiruegeria haliotis]|uniref:Uncharacterized protein n=1 Tax=Aliiruegeria haliotis TaxID=1280846 RepID=A0A2T0RJA5_9RHOB|nr:hypothetical protein CLV78_110149 [Aliiruegeria haliotis]